MENQTNKASTYEVSLHDRLPGEILNPWGRERKIPKDLTESYLLIEYPDKPSEWVVFKSDFAFEYEDRLLMWGQGILCSPRAFYTLDEVTAWCKLNGREALIEELNVHLAQSLQEEQALTQAEKDAVFAEIAANI